MRRSNECDCGDNGEFRGNAVQAKVQRDLIRVAYGPNFGDVLYRCRSCGQWWEENLSEATYHDWPPVLQKVSEDVVREKYGDDTIARAEETNRTGDRE